MLGLMDRRTSRRGKRYTSRRGSITGPGFSAREHKDSDPRLRGRIAVDRGSGVVEFPNRKQFDKIAREEGIPREDVDIAFGHLGRLTRNARKKREIRHGYLFASETLKGTPKQLQAQTVEAPGSWGIERAIWIEIDGESQPLYRPADAMRRVAPWFKASQFKQAFGDLLGGSLAPGLSQGKYPDTYGARSLRLAHDDGKAVRPGVRKGSLILQHAASGTPVWSAYDVSGGEAVRAPIAISFAGKQSNVSFRTGFTRAMERNIPPLAFLQAFGHLLPPAERKELYAQLSPR
jgi:hypothetical protein